MQLCVRRGADAFLVKPLGSEEVQHIWQFVKNNSQGSFHRRADTDPQVGSSSIGSSSSSADPTPSVLASAGQSARAPDSSIIVCGGCADSATVGDGDPRSAAQCGASIGGDASASASCSAEGAGQAYCAHSAWSSADPAESLLDDKEPVGPELRTDEPVGADCKQQ